MGFPTELFVTAPLEEEFLCSFCLDILEKPEMAEPCEHIFCENCIATWLSDVSNRKLCPICRSAIKNVRSPHRAFVNILNRQELHCRFKILGCLQVIHLADLKEHESGCNENPNKILCFGGCGTMLQNNEKSDHKCVEYLTAQLKLKDVAIELFVADMEFLSLKNKDLDLTLQAVRARLIHNLSTTRVSQFYVNVEKKWKLETLCDLYDTFHTTQSVVFCNTSRKVEWLTSKLQEKEFRVSAVHDNINRREREANTHEFCHACSGMLIADDLLASEINIQEVALVINYDIPTNRENYILRIGRGHTGRKHVAINIVTDEDQRILMDIGSYYHFLISELPMNLDDLF